MRHIGTLCHDWTLSHCQKRQVFRTVSAFVELADDVRKQKNAGRRSCSITFAWPTVLAPVDPALRDPEVTAAIVLLMDRWLHGRAQEPVQSDGPPRSALRIEGERDSGPTPSRAFETRPFLDSCVDHEDKLARNHLVLHGIGLGLTRQQVEFDQPEPAEGFRDQALHDGYPIRCRKGVTSARPQIVSFAHRSHSGRGTQVLERSSTASKRRRRSVFMPPSPRNAVRP